MKQTYDNYYKEYYLKNKDKILSRQKDNPDLKDYQHEYYILNKERFREKRRARAIFNKALRAAKKKAKQPNTESQEKIVSSSSDK